MNLDDVLTVAMEEAAEVIQATSKIIRFGAKTEYPGKGMSNEEHLAVELNQLIAVLEMAQDLGIDLTVHRVDILKAEKKYKVRQHFLLKGKR